MTVSMVGGVVPVLATAFHPDGTVDRKSFRRFADHVAGQEVAGVMFPGFASEFYKLASDERELLLNDMLTVTADHPGVLAVASVSEHATPVAVAEVRRLVERGVDAVNILPPQFMAPTRSQVIEHIHQVLAAASPCGVILQLAPGDVSVSLEPADVSALRREHPNLVAAKVEARPPGRLIAALRAQEPPVDCLAGTGGLYLWESLQDGAVGVQPGSSFAEVYVALWRCWTSEDYAACRRLYRRLLEYLVLWAGHQELLVAVEKAIAHRRGLLDSDTCRMPHHGTTEYESAQLERFLDDFSDLLIPTDRKTST